MRNMLNDYGYVKLSEKQTTEFINSNVALLDEVMQTPEDDFSIFTANNYEWLVEKPVEVFEKFFMALEDTDLDKYQRGFLDYAKVNVLTPLKWYKKNGNTVNLSEKQAAWFRKWFTKHGINADCIPSPVKQNVVRPRFEV